MVYDAGNLLLPHPGKFKIMIKHTRKQFIRPMQALKLRDSVIDLSKLMFDGTAY